MGRSFNVFASNPLAFLSLALLPVFRVPPDEPGLAWQNPVTGLRCLLHLPTRRS